MAYERAMRALFFLPLLFLAAACEPEPENIQAKAETMSRQLEERANQIRAEAENGVEASAAPMENEADALLQRIAANEANAVGNEGDRPADAQ
jgi:hypothetical protein